MFKRMYSPTGQPSIPPERILKSLLLIALYSVRSERQFCEKLEYSLLFRWFLDMNLTEEGFDATVFTKNRERLSSIFRQQTWDSLSPDNIAYIHLLHEIS